MNIYHWWPLFQEFLWSRWPRNPVMRRNYGRWVWNHNVPTDRREELLDGFSDWATGHVERHRVLGWLRQTIGHTGD